MFHPLALAGYGTAIRVKIFNFVQVWDTVEEYDTGCTPGGGKDGIGVFFDAGLLFVSDTASGTPHRQGYITRFSVTAEKTKVSPTTVTTGCVSRTQLSSCVQQEEKRRRDRKEPG